MRESEKKAMLKKANAKKLAKQSTYDEVKNQSSRPMTFEEKKAKAKAEYKPAVQNTPSMIQEMNNKTASKRSAKITTDQGREKRSVIDKITAAEKKATSKKSTANKKPFASGKVSFKTAFANARKAGMKTFTWNGKKYTTQIKDNAAKKSKQATGMSAGNTVAGTRGQKSNTAKKSDNKKDNKSYYGSLSKAKTGGSKLPPIPAGAKKWTTGIKFNDKTHTLRKIGNRPGMYLVPRKK